MPKAAQLTKIKKLDQAEFERDYTEVSGYRYDSRKYYDYATDQVILPKWLTELIKAEVAQAAKEIRQELKQFFPGTKFKVTSDNYSGGNAVRVKWVDGPRSKEVEVVVGKYQYGHFDGMTDSYEYTNRRNDISQVRFVSTSRELSDDYRASIINRLETAFGGTFEPNKWNDQFHCYNDVLIYRVSTGCLQIP